MYDAKPLPPPPLPVMPLAYGTPQDALTRRGDDDPGGFARLSARLSWMAPAIAMLFFLVAGGAGDEPVGRIIAGVGVAILFAGVLFGVMALGNIRRLGRSGILGPAVTGLILNVMLLGLFTWLGVTFVRAEQRARAAIAAAQPAIAPAGGGATNFTMPAQPASPATLTPDASADTATAIAPVESATAASPAASPAAAPVATPSPVDGHPGWVGVTDRTDLRIVVLQWHDDAPGRRKLRELYTADSTIITVVINNSVGSANVTIDPASLEFHFNDYTTLKALPPKQILETAKFDRDYCVSRYGGDWNVAPRQVRTDGLAFFPPGTDLTNARAVTMMLNGQRIVVPGKYFPADEKAHVLGQLQVGR
jgi:hypothetical protein